MNTLPNTLYTRRLTRQYPGLFVILLDQSGSMFELIPSLKQSKAEVATAAINTIILEMINKAGFDEFDPSVRKKYAYLSVLGYNDTVYPLLGQTDQPIDIPTLADHPLATVQVQRVVRSRTGKERRWIEKRPIWIQPTTQGNTQMALAFQNATRIVQGWLSSPPELSVSNPPIFQALRNECFPPIVINITDAQDNGGADPLEATQQLRLEGTTQGDTLIFNCHFTKEMGRPCIFPSQISEVEHLDAHGLARKMFEMSSLIPESLRQGASELSHRSISPDARCFVYNADADILIKFLRWGTFGQAVTGA